MSGSGKTLALKIIKKHGYDVFDCDMFSTNQIVYDTTIINKLKNLTGLELKHGDYNVLKRLGKYFECNVEKEKEFEKWYQPYLGNTIKKHIVSCNKNTTFVDVPFLKEKKLIDFFDSVCIIRATRKKCFERIKIRNNYNDEKIKYLLNRSRISKECIQRADIIIENNDNDYSEYEDKLLKTMKYL